MITIRFYSITQLILRDNYMYNSLKKESSLKLKNSLIVTLILTAFCALLCSCASGGKDLAAINSMRQFFCDNKYIIHACGFITDENGEQFDYTNSKEGLINSYEQGNRIIEIDFHFTSDNVLVCGHAWGDLYRDGTQMTPGEPLSYDDFLTCKVQDRFTVLSFEDVAEFMKAHEDLIVVTDTKETNEQTCTLIAEKYPELRDRFIVQIYHDSEYDMVKKLGFKYIIYTLYEATEEELTEASLLKASKKPLVGFTFYADLADDDNFMSIMNKTDTPLFVHTVNEDDALKHYFDLGINAIYTDRTDLSK